jgi:hypothetical protein
MMVAVHAPTVSRSCLNFCDGIVLGLGIPDIHGVKIMGLASSLGLLVFPDIPWCVHH